MNSVALRYPLSALISYHYFAEEDIAQLEAVGLRMIGDSGAFSAANLGAPISLDSFAAWAHKWRENLAWIASLDAIGDPKRSWANYRELRGAGLDVVPTIHLGAPPKELDRYADDGVDFVGLGGVVSGAGNVLETLRWLVAVFRYARDAHPGMRFHGWGCTSTRLVLPLPWYSVDSSSFGSAWRYGRMRLFDPKTKGWHQFATDGRGAFAHGRLLRSAYGVDPAAVAVSSPDTRRDLVRTAAKAYQLYEDYLRKRHNVTPPGYGIRAAAVGPSIHVTDTYTGHMEMLGSHAHIALAPSGEVRTLIKTMKEDADVLSPRIHQK